MAARATSVALARDDRPGDPFAALLAERGAFGRAAAGRRLAALRRAEAAPLPRGATALRALHDLLLLLAAHPESDESAARIDALLDRVAEAAARIAAMGRGSAAFAGAGIRGVPVESAASWSIARWLAAHRAAEAAIAWDDAGSGGVEFEELLQYVALPIEQDGLVGNRLDAAAWLALGRGSEASTGEGAVPELADLVRLLERLPAEGVARERVWDALALSIAWRPGAVTGVRRSANASETATAALGGGGATGARFPEVRTKPWRMTRPRRRRIDARRVILAPFAPAAPLDARRAADLVDVARAALVARGRETEALAHPNLAEVTIDALDSGIDVALIGMEPERRLPIESFVGFVAARGRVPVAYGGAWIHGRRSEIGVNVFDAFRGGESALLFASIMRVYRQRFAVRRFTVDPYQFGADNEEGLRSGAYWFYDRLGFRSVDAELRRLATRERDAKRRDPRHRSTRATLRRLATDRVALDLPAAAGDRRGPDAAARRIIEAPLSALGLATTAWIGRRFAGDRDAARRAARRLVDAALGVAPRDRAAWSAEEQGGYDRLAPLAAQIEDLADWSARDRAALVKLLRAKGGPREEEYTRRVREHPRWLPELAAIAARADVG